MDITANQIRIDKFQKAIADFKEFFEQVNDCFKFNFTLGDGEDLSYQNDLVIEFMDFESIVCFTIADYNDGVHFYVSSVKYYPATWYDPPNFDTYDEVKFDNHYEAIREMVKRYIDFNIDSMIEYKSELELDIFEDLE